MPDDPQIVARHEALVQAVLHFIAAHPGMERDDAAFDQLALALFSWQYDRIAPYRRLCDHFGIDPQNVGEPARIPAIPAEAHKDQLLFTWRTDEAVRVFRTSGTTQGMRGSHFFRTLRCYDAACWQSFQTMMLPEGGADWLLAYLVQSPVDAPDSSLGHMLAVVVNQLAPSQRPFCLTSEGLDLEHIARLLDTAVAENMPLVLGTTAFALARLLEETTTSWRLPAGSRIMETGGFKGHHTSYDRNALFTAVTDRLGIPASHIVSEYGMTELSSQCYTGSLRQLSQGDAPSGGFLPPPWMRLRIIDPDSGAAVPTGEPGLIQLLDLANVDSVAAIYTADLGRLREDGSLELMGRLAGATQRGCSLAAAEILGEWGDDEEW